MILCVTAKKKETTLYQFIWNEDSGVLILSTFAGNAYIYFHHRSFTQKPIILQSFMMGHGIGEKNQAYFFK